MGGEFVGWLLFHKGLRAKHDVCIGPEKLYNPFSHEEVKPGRALCRYGAKTEWVRVKVQVVEAATCPTCAQPLPDEL